MIVSGKSRSVSNNILIETVERVKIMTSEVEKAFVENEIVLKKNAPKRILKVNFQLKCITTNRVKRNRIFSRANVGEFNSKLTNQ